MAPDIKEKGTKRRMKLYAEYTAYKPLGPGPSYGIESALTNKGREPGPSYSMLGRAKTPKRDISPGPGAYNTDRKPLREKNAPLYSLSPRTSPRRVDFTPSPNMYVLPPTIGTRLPDRVGGPATSQHGRLEHNSFAADLAKTPGPANYSPWSPELVRRRAPQYSLGARAKTPVDKNKVPGPGTYHPENVTMHLEKSPRHAIGVKHSSLTMPVLPMANVD
ncbi:hypothetical protein FSP39_021563 [Pinctada imbricata]|uniref:Outer dense fiber protein 3 n=1 Tax=Pinctada imbricata TaxID=66713 RepID=A0AA88Y527_PINIB|nr:hypothetical protein FSP39_021563 [Pinctada imbricata]